MLYKKVWKRPTEQKRDEQIREAIAYCHRSRHCHEGNLAYAPGDRPCLETQTGYDTAIKLDFQVAPALRAYRARGWMGCIVWVCNSGGMEYYGADETDAITNAEDSDVEASELAYQAAVSERIAQVRAADGLVG